METYGVILARVQPVHNGHLALIEKALKENDKVLVLVGSADKCNARNPIPISLRMQMLEEALTDHFGEVFANHKSERITVYGLDDLTSESDNNHEWGFYLYSTIVGLTNNARFTMYYSDGFEIITTWFPGFILKNYVSLSLLARNSVHSGISATSVRKFIIEGDVENLQKFTPKSVYEKVKILAEFIKLQK